MKQYIRVRNWSKYQHYKDRNPPWVKLHQGLLTSEEWVLGNDAQRCLLITLILLAARNDNRIYPDPAYIQKVGHLDGLPDLDWALQVGFIEPCEPSEKWQAPWPSRHVNADVRAQVSARDKNQCVFCGATQSLEVDHIIPVSQGGPSKIENLQLLCRTCNRKKRTRVANATRCVADATTNHSSAYPETETETEAEKIYRSSDTSNDQDRFAEFWQVYPNKVGKKPSREKWKRKKLDRIADTIIADVRQRAAKDRKWLDGFVPNPLTYINQERWCDEITPPKEIATSAVARSRQGIERYLAQGGGDVE